MKAAVFPEERNHFINKPGPSVNTWSQHISVTCPSSSAGAQVSAQQAHGNTGLLDGGRLLEAQSCDGLHGHREEGEGVRMEHRGDQGGGERRSWWRRDGGQGGVEMGVRVEERVMVPSGSVGTDSCCQMSADRHTEMRPRRTTLGPENTQMLLWKH